MSTSHYHRSRDSQGKLRGTHIVRAERALGKPLPRGAVVHHADGSQHKDAPLVICQDHAYHMLLHTRMRVVAAGGDPNTQRICSMCKQLRLIAEFPRVKQRPNGMLGNCRSCMADAARERWRRNHPGFQARAPYNTRRLRSKAA